MSDTPTPYIYYIHGFNSSPQSFKAIVLGQIFKDRGMEAYYRVPDLPVQFGAAIRLLEEQIERDLPHPICLIGSSLGGFYATYLAEKYDLKAALINPAVDAHLLLRQAVGENKNYHTGETYQLSDKDVDELTPLEVNPINKKDNFLMLAQTGDETLDYRKAVKLYDGCKQIVQQGGSHGFDDFELMVPEIFHFFGIE